MAKEHFTTKNLEHFLVYNIFLCSSKMNEEAFFEELPCPARISNISQEQIMTEKKEKL